MAPLKHWLPGVLSNLQIIELCQEGCVRHVENPDTSCYYSALDLTLGSEGYRMVKGSVKPFGVNFQHFLIKHGLAELLCTDKNGHYTLQAKNTYLFKIREQLFQSELVKLGIY